jgi:hypothetical protein
MLSRSGEQRVVTDRSVLSDLDNDTAQVEVTRPQGVYKGWVGERRRRDVYGNVARLVEQACLEQRPTNSQKFQGWAEASVDGLGEGDVRDVSGRDGKRLKASTPTARSLVRSTRSEARRRAAAAPRGAQGRSECGRRSGTLAGA